MRRRPVVAVTEMPDQEDIETHLRMLYGEPAVEDVSEQEQANVRERERVLADSRRVRLCTGREVFVFSVEVEFTWDGSMEGFPSEDILGEIRRRVHDLDWDALAKDGDF